jgi:hypothetical protein
MVNSSNRRQRFVRLSIEALEDRITPAGDLLVWTGFDKNVNTNWSDRFNWLVNGGFPLQGPRAIDSVQFDSAQVNSTDDVAQVTNLTITGNYAGTITIVATLTITGANSSMAAGTLGVGNFVINTNASFTWTGGTLKGSGNTTNNGTMTISGANDKTLDGTNLNDNSTVTWQDGGNILLKNFSQVFVGTQATFNANSPAAIKDVGGGAFPSVFNVTASQGQTAGGTLNVSPGANNNTTMNVLLSTGAGSSTNINTGGLITNLGSDLNGTITIAGNSDISLQSSDPKVDKLDGCTITGTGTTIFTGHVTVGADSSIATTVSDGSNKVDGSGTLSISGFYDWQGNPGVWIGSGSMKILSTGLLKLQYTIQGQGAYPLGRTVDNFGTVTWSSAGRDISVSNGATIHNENGATFTIAVDNNILNNGGGFFINAGLLQKTAASGTTSIALLFAGGNTGTIDVKSGKLQTNQ